MLVIGRGALLRPLVSPCDTTEVGTPVWRWALQQTQDPEPNLQCRTVARKSERWGSPQLSHYVGAAVTAFCLRSPPPACNTRQCATQDQALTSPPPLKQNTLEHSCPSGSAHPATSLLHWAWGLRWSPLHVLGCILITAAFRFSLGCGFLRARPLYLVLCGSLPFITSVQEPIPSECLKQDLKLCFIKTHMVGYLAIIVCPPRPLALLFWKNTCPLIIFRWQITIIRSWAIPTALQYQTVVLGPDWASEDRTQQCRMLGKSRHRAGASDLNCAYLCCVTASNSPAENRTDDTDCFFLILFLWIQMHVFPLL